MLENLACPLDGDETGKCLLDLAIWRSQVSLRTTALVERCGWKLECRGVKGDEGKGGEVMGCIIWKLFFVVKETRAEDGGGHMGVTEGLLKVSLGRRVLLELDWRGLKVQKKHMWKPLDGH